MSINLVCSWVGYWSRGCIRIRYGIVSMGTPGMTAGQATCGQQGTLEGAMGFNSFKGIGRATGDMAAVAGHHGADSIPIDLDGNNQERSHHAYPDRSEPGLLPEDFLASFCQISFSAW